MLFGKWWVNHADALYHNNEQKIPIDQKMQNEFQWRLIISMPKWFQKPCFKKFKNGTHIKDTWCPCHLQ